MANVAKNTNKRWVVARLNEVLEGKSETSYYLLRGLEGKYLKPVFVKENGGRGRPTKKYEVTAAGKNLVRLAKFWPAA